MFEPMWAVPYHLVITYASLYMLELGCSGKQVGIVTSVSLVASMICSLLGGYITDKLGRRKTTFIFDLIAWSIPALIWAFAGNFGHFIIAAIINGLTRIVYTSWNCLFIEDTQPSQRVYAYTWIFVAVILAGFFTPLAGVLVKRFSLVPTMRGLYLFAFVSMSTMFLLRNALTRETAIGLRKMELVKKMRFDHIVRDYWKSGLRCLRNPVTMLAFLFVIIVNIHQTIRATFLSILLAGDLKFRAFEIAVFPALYSAVMLIVSIFVIPAIGKLRVERSLQLSLFFNISGYLLLVVAPSRSYPLVILSTILTAAGTAIANPIVESLLANSIIDEDRATVLSLFYVLLFAVTSPFGYFSGVLTTISNRLPFVLLMALLIMNVFLSFAFSRVKMKEETDGKVW